MAYLTYFDLVESLITSSFGGPQDAEQRDIRTAIQKAYAELTTIRDWGYYSVHGRVVTSAAYSAGTIEISSGVATLAGGSFATAGVTAANAHDWTIRVANRSFQVGAYTSSTAVTLDPQFAGFDVSAGSSYVLFRTVYPLPSDFRNMDEPSDEWHWWSGLYITPDEAMKIERISNKSGHPFHWTVMKDPHGTGWALKLVGWPAGVETVDFTYRRSPRAIRYSGHEASMRQGTISSSGTAVTGSGTAFMAAMVGSVVRSGDTANSPGPIESLTPWSAESKITGASSATAMTTESALSAASATKYLITDPIDIAPHMQLAMKSACDYWLARTRNQAPDKAFQMYQRDLRLAFEQDQLAPLSGRSRTTYHDGGWRSPMRPDQG